MNCSLPAVRETCSTPCLHWPLWRERRILHWQQNKTNGSPTIERKQGTENKIDLYRKNANKRNREGPLCRPASTSVGCWLAKAHWDGNARNQNCFDFQRHVMVTQTWLKICGLSFESRAPVHYIQRGSGWLSDAAEIGWHFCIWNSISSIHAGGLKHHSAFQYRSRARCANPPRKKSNAVEHRYIHSSLSYCFKRGYKNVILGISIEKLDRE